MIRRAALALLILAAAACGDAAVPSTTTRPVATTTSVPPQTTTTMPTATTDTPVTTTLPGPTTTIVPPPTTTVTTPPPPAGALVEITYADGEVSGPRQVTVKVGDPVRLEVTSDVPDEVHVHGYDLFGSVGPQQVAEIEFEADVPGIFEIELEGEHTTLVELVVEP